MTGGATRAESVRAALEEVPEDALVALVHDAARPLVTDAVIERVLAPLSEGWDGVVPGLAVADTVKSVDGDRVVATIAREKLVAVQTPQAFPVATPPRRLRRRARGRDRLRFARRGARRPRQLGRGRPAPAEGDDAGRPGARLLVALKAVVFDVGETLIDETRLWERAADAAGVPASR